MQEDRFLRGETSASANAELSSRDVERIAAPDAAGLRLIVAAVERLGLSARAYGKVLRVARTIADLAGEGRVSAIQLAEALQYRAYEARRALAVGLP